MLIGVIAEELLSPLSVTEHITLVDVDVFRLHRIFQIGFVSPGLVDETDIFGDEKLPTTYVTQDYLEIFPDLFDDTVPETETFYEFTRSSVPVLAPDIWRDYDFIWSPDLAIKAISPAGVFVDHDIIYAPALLGSIFPALVLDNDIIRAQIIRRDGDDFVLLTEAFNDVDTIFSATTATGLLPGVVNDGDIIYPAGQAAFLAPAAFSPGDTFFSAFVYNQLNPSRIIDADVFIGPAMFTPGNMDLVDDDDIIFASSLQRAPLLPSLLDDADTFLSPVIGDIPPIYPFDSIVDFEDTFYAPQVSIGLFLTPHLWPDLDVILSVAGVVLGQVIAPTAVFDDADAFHAPVLPPTLSPALYAPADSFFAPTLIFDQALQPDWYIDTDVFQVPTLVGPSPARSAMVPGVFINADISRQAYVDRVMINK